MMRKIEKIHRKGRRSLEDRAGVKYYLNSRRTPRAMEQTSTRA